MSGACTQRWSLKRFSCYDVGWPGNLYGWLELNVVSSVEPVNTELRYTSTAVYVYSSSHYFLSGPAVYQSFEMRSRLGDELIRAHSDAEAETKFVFKSVGHDMQVPSSWLTFLASAGKGKQLHRMPRVASPDAVVISWPFRESVKALVDSRLPAT